jgi:hypothetical protein
MANTVQKRWMSDIADFISETGLGGLYGPEFENRFDFQLHHVVGRTGKHNKIAIGHEFVIPVPTELHEVMSNHPDNVSNFKNSFTKRFGSQCSIYQVLYACMGQWGYELPGDEIYQAIMDTRK